MPVRAMHRFGVVLATTGAMLGMLAEAGAQRRRSDNASQGIPVATNRIVQDPGAYYGKVVTVSAGVEQMLSMTAFVLDQRRAAGATGVKAIGKPILVIAPYLAASLNPNGYLMVRGEIVKFDAAAIARVAPGYTLDLAPDVSARYYGQPVLVASSVINSVFLELVRKPAEKP
jgi:hypothetical protein